ncbi:MAG: GNAT family N-acetyltransferase [Deltaproteobacteria bacterium]|nr:GNAT family N-acetyltransferase [Deltaproteobacteria bacterium]
MEKVEISEGILSSKETEEIVDLASMTGFFNSEELIILRELACECYDKKNTGDYQFILGKNYSGKIIGFSCWGKIPGTASGYDLYWIAVDKKYQGNGLGRFILETTEKEIHKKGGSRIYIETSSRELYIPTTAFYKKSGYTKAAMLEDFYADGDSKIIFQKVL